MIAKATLHFDASTFLLVVATILFLLAAFASGRWAKGWFIPVGLACFSAAFWLNVIVS